jgi:Enolase C-terminal domain-like
MSLAIDAVQNFNVRPWSIKQVVRMLEILEPYDLAWAEEPDATIIGGISEARRACESAAARGVQVALHVWGCAPAVAANYQLAFTMPNCVMLECPIMNNLLQQEALTVKWFGSAAGDMRRLWLPRLGRDALRRAGLPDRVRPTAERARSLPNSSAPTARVLSGRKPARMAVPSPGTCTWSAQPRVAELGSTRVLVSWTKS